MDAPAVGPEALFPPPVPVARVTQTPDTVHVHRDIPFQETGERTLSLDLYETDAGGPKPAAVLVRGGGFVHGDKGEFARHALDLAADGYLVVEPQYRLAPEHTFPAALVDVKAAIEWVRAEGDSYGADPEQVVGVGHSAGANLVVLAAATADDPAFEPDLYPAASSALSAVVGYSGVYDFRALEPPAGDEPAVHRQYLGGGPAELPEAYDLASPVTHVDTATPPTLLLHGAADETVPPAQSELLAEAMAPVADVTYETVEGDHAFPFHGALYDEVYDRTTTFLDRVRGGPDPTAVDRGGPGPDGTGTDRL